MSGIRLVEELRQAHDAAEYYVYPEWAQMFKAAADRVEHLEAENARQAAEIERLTSRPIVLPAPELGERLTPREKP